MNGVSRHRIGLFDSGLGGLSVLRSLWKETGDVDYIYFADLINAPYGRKSKKEVLEFSQNAFQYLLEQNCDAVLFACNTATSAAANLLRQTHSIPIFGMEPAVKPASLDHPDRPIAIFATELTLKEEKFKNLLESMGAKNEFIFVPCEGLAKLIDEDVWEDAWDFLDAKIKTVISKTNVFVLGCTHYVFLKERINYVYPDVKVYDGNLGTSLHIKNALQIPGSGKNNLDILLNTHISDYVHLANRIAKSFSASHTLSLTNTITGKINV
ncbi:glutamate racemase [Leptospira idonii]|uniref:Glutamate racemase n=1 Tax=Leptospira idonii TaxID=1193500 RepID=A0A4R9LZU9_9LEPT|nr:glutamate racemase [Leptospira idonii]TGN19181.1 glutamate racemase [Leptospira idonii]